MYFFHFVFLFCSNSYSENAENNISIKRAVEDDDDEDVKRQRRDDSGLETV